MYNTAAQRERIMLAGLHSPDEDDAYFDALLGELAALVQAAGGEVVGEIIQKRDRPDGAHYFGKGKLAEAAEQFAEHPVDLVVFDRELSPAQLRNLERLLHTPILDRTGLILDIFAQRARSLEGKLQVELAQLSYRLPRLSGMGSSLSRLGGGIGTRGPGETKLEADRRTIRQRMTAIRHQLARSQAVRQTQRVERTRHNLKQVALVGYTNAGKSSLLNALTGAGPETAAEVMDQVFATLDPLTRRLELPGQQTCLLTDTVGFVRRLPHQLVAAFRATLESVIEADFLLLVVDASSLEASDHISTVFGVLHELARERFKTSQPRSRAANREMMHAPLAPGILVLNKVDRLDATSQSVILAELAAQVKEQFPDWIAVPVSTLDSTGLNQLKNELADWLTRQHRCHQLLIPYENMAMIDALHQHAQVLYEEYQDEGVLIEAELDIIMQEKTKQYHV